MPDPAADLAVDGTDNSNGNRNGASRGAGARAAAGGLTTSLAGYVGVVVDEHGVTIDVRPDVANHVGSRQGGVTAALPEAAALTALDGGMTVTYLAQGRRDPIRAECGPRRTGAATVVDAVDLGTDRRPVAHAVLAVGRGQAGW